MANFKKFLFLTFFCFLVPLSLVQCTSGAEDDTALEEELAEMEDESLDELGDLDEVADEDLEDIVDEEDDMGLDEDDSIVMDEGDDDEFDEEDEFDDEDDELADADDEFDEFDDDEFDEFDDSDDGEKDQFAQGEEDLKKELAKNDYPVAQNAEAQFPEEVMGDQNPNPGPAQAESPIPPGMPLITSETQEIPIADDPIEPQLPQDDLGMADPIVPLDDDQPNSGPTWIPVVKVKTDPFFRNDRLLNTVYIARPGDDITSVSEKIFGEDRSKELLADNGHLAKGIDPGDKVYYNSPNRVDDRSQLKIHYEDIGLPPQYYKTKADDNMRRLGSKLLGFAEGWKELWAINSNVDSKTILPAGLELKYWTGNERKKSLEMAEQETEELAPEPPLDDPSLAESTTSDGPAAMGQVAEEDPFQESELPPEEPLPEADLAMMPEPELEPDPMDQEAFPEPGVDEVPAMPTTAMARPQTQDTSLLTMGAVALLLIAGAGLVAIQIKKRKDSTGLSPQSLEYTQV